MTHHQRVNGDIDFSALDLPDFLMRDRERRGNPKPTLARMVCSNQATFKPDPMELSKVMAADYSAPSPWRAAVVGALMRAAVAAIVIGGIAVAYYTIAHMWPH